MKHPLQRIEIDSQGVTRFTGNEIIKHLISSHPGALNSIAARFSSPEFDEDWMQLMGLIGSSVWSFTTDERVSPGLAAVAELAAKIHSATGVDLAYALPHDTNAEYIEPEKKSDQ